MKDHIVARMLEIIPHIPHCKKLGITVVDADLGRLSLALPYSKSIVGNPDTGVIDGGTLTTLLDTACGFAAACTQGQELEMAPTLDLRIDYMKSAEPGLTVICDAEAYRVSTNIIFARGIAFHEHDKENPIAHCSASFMRIDPKRLQNNR
jgi:uncharacterized protein (TIGR00369 family)